MSRLSGLLTKRTRIQKVLDGSFRFVGTVIAKSKEITTGAISQWVGGLVKRIWIQKSLTSSMSEWVGTLTKRIRIQKSLDGILGFTGTVTAVTAGLTESLAGLLTLTGALTKRIWQSKVVTGTVGFIGTLSIVSASVKSIAGSMIITSSLVARPIVTEIMYYGVENP